MPVRDDDYDAVPYPCSAHHHTHPNQLAAMGLLHGLNPAPVERCRVLEIGCNDAGNIIPMAYAVPGSEFVGFDLAAGPVARAQGRIQELGLTNIRVFQANLMDVGHDLGLFDYIIAHGVYAWVPEPVREGLLAFCKTHLGPQGIAFISYNALPGGHLRALMRDILLQPIAGAEEAAAAGPVVSVEYAKQFLRFITESRPEGDPFRVILEHEAKQLQKKQPEVVCHDEMALYWRPVAFSAFAAHAASHGLQWLSESVLPPPTDPCYQPRVAGSAKALAGGDPIAEEQILDYARMRMYRETLLCHAERDVDRDLRLEAFERFRLASKAEATTDEKTGLRVFTLPGGIRMESEHPATVLLIDHLIGAWPQSVPFLDAVALLERNGVAFDAELLTLLLRLVVSRMVELHTWQPPVSSRIAERPLASAVSRLEAASQTRAATLLHTTLGLGDPMVRALLLLLDGTRNRAELLKELRAAFPDVPEGTIAAGLEPSLRLLHQTGVLLADEAG